MTVTDIMPAWPTPLRQLLLTLPDIFRSLSIVALAALLTACRMEANFIFYPSATIEHTPRQGGSSFAMRDEPTIETDVISGRENHAFNLEFYLLGRMLAFRDPRG